MPRFIFNHTSYENISVAESGAVFPSLEDAYLHTYNAILDTAFEKLRERFDPTGDTFEIVNERGDLLAIIPFSEMLRPHHMRGRTGSPTEQLVAISAC